MLERTIPLIEPLENRLWMSGLLIEMNFYTERHNHIELLQKSLKAAIELGNRPEIAWSTYHIAWNKIYVEEQYDEAIQLLEEADQIFREVGDVEGVTWALVYRGVAALAKGDAATARAMAQEVVDGHQFNKFPWSYAGALYLLGDIALHENNLLVAREYFREAVNQAYKVHSIAQVRRHLVGVAEVLAAEGDLTGAYAIAHYMYAFLNPLDQDIHERAGKLMHRIGPELDSEARQSAIRRYEGAELDVLVREVLE
jgi:tetratricopeptide (TPR) repeat protein